MENISIRLKRKREEKGLSQRALGHLIGVSATAISQWEREETTPKGKHLLNLSKALGCTPEWLSGKKGAQESLDQFVHIPFHCEVKVAAGHGCNGDSHEDSSVISLPRSFFKYADINNLSAICVHGDSMEPVLKHDSIVVIDTDVDELRDGSMYVLLQGDLLRVKLISQFVGGICLRSYNPNYRDETYENDEINTIKVLGRVIWHSSSLQ
ncbi:helix-turn-helix domain-containing protein [Vibrio parahaemolyticus]|uniref:S24 family peptidase n=1 Tax=Vibrio parahaemolyticus TaxID=670 RepID=UPI001EEC7688|nr:S24 family peptidase [Vibrio parahaemolyticus]MCG6459673.1 helix-turn-helix domain-containing protein [Vibrio parahaemolyticus]